MRNSKDFTYDNSLLMKDAGLVAATAEATVAGSTRILDLGTGRINGRVIIDTTAVETDTGNEKYEILVRVSSSATMATDVWIAGEVRLGHSSTTLETVTTTAVGRRELHFTNEINGVAYRYAELYTVVAGTIATGINYTGFLVKE